MSHAVLDVGPSIQIEWTNSPRLVMDIIRGAMRSLGVLRSGEEPSASEAADALHTLNDMLNAWRLKGIDLEFLGLKLTDALPYPDDHVSAIRYGLAVELAPEYGVEPPGVVVAMAGSTYADLKTHYVSIGMLSVDAALSPRYGWHEDLT
jgi:hypothetical protein